MLVECRYSFIEIILLNIVNTKIMETKREWKFIDTILDVPYFSQYLDVNQKLHMLTACGMTSVYMTLKYYSVECESLDKLVEKGIESGGYNKSGWLHDYLVDVFKNHGIKCERMENMKDRDIQNIFDSLKNKNPVIISMQSLSFDRRIFHMVIIVGYKENEQGDLEGFFYHDPAGLVPEEATNLFVSIPVFLQYWRKMAIFPINK